MPAWRIFVFIAVTLALFLGVHYYLWARLVRDPQLPAEWTRGLTYAFIGLSASVPLAAIFSRVLPRSVGSPLMWVVYTWMGLVTIFFFVLVPADVVRVVVTKVRPFDPDRRDFFARAFAGTVGLVGTGLSGVGIASALRRVGVVPVRVGLRNLPSELEGYKIVQLSDVHVGPTIGREFIEELVETVNREKPDAVVITGDLVDGSVEQIGPFVEPLRKLRARDGVFFVTGNHEYYSGVDKWIAFLKDLGIRVLRNERVAIREDVSSGFYLAGVDDHSAARFGGGHGTNLDKALGGREPSRPVVLLAHQPKTILEAVKHGIDLQLSGHTHGGQIWPWGYAVRLDQPHIAGLSRHEEAQIYVSRGTGYWGPPMRVGAPAEVTRIELYAA